MSSDKIKVVGVAGELTGWKTTIALHAVLEAMKKVNSNVTTELIEMKEYDVEFVTGEPLSYYNDDTWEVVNKVSSADILVFATPIYQASITGALKNLLDYFPIDAFNRKVTGMVTVGGIEKHFRSEEHTSELQSRGHLVCRLLLEKKITEIGIGKTLCGVAVLLKGFPHF